MLSMLHACTAASAPAVGRDWNDLPIPPVPPALVRAVGDLRAAAFAQAVVEAYVANGQQPVACRKHGPAAPDAPPSWTARLGMSRAEFDSVAARVAVRIRPGADDGAPSRTGAPLVRYWRDGRRTWWQPDMDAWRALWREPEFGAPSAASPPANDIPSQEGEDNAACAASALPASCSGRSGPRLLCDLVDTAVAELLHGLRPAAGAAPETADAPWSADDPADAPWPTSEQASAWRDAADAWLGAMGAWRGVAECWRPDNVTDDERLMPHAVSALREADRRYDIARAREGVDGIVDLAAWRAVACAAQIAADIWCGIAEVWRPDDGGRQPLTPDRDALTHAHAAWRQAAQTPLDSPDAPLRWYDAAIASQDAAHRWWRSARHACAPDGLWADDEASGVSFGGDGRAWR